MNPLFIDRCPRCRMFAVYEGRDPSAYLCRCDACGVLALAPSRPPPPGVTLAGPEIHLGRRTVTLGDALVVEGPWPFRRPRGVPAPSVEQLYVGTSGSAFALIARDTSGLTYSLLDLDDLHLARWLELELEERLGLWDFAVTDEVRA